MNDVNLTDIQAASLERADQTPLPEKVSLVSSDGTKYLAFRRSLKAHRGRLFCQLLFVVTIICAAVLVPTVWLRPHSVALSLLVALGLASVLGFAEYVLGLYGHAAAHGDLATRATTNDAIANTFIFPLTGITIATYRRVHFAHHRLLGREGDPEDGHREALDWRFVIRSVTGVRFVQSVLRYTATPESSNTHAHNHRSGWSAVRMSGGILHLAAVVIPTVVGAWFVSLAWLLAFVVVLPTLNALRLILEHRPTGGTSVDGRDAVTRCFRGRWCASSFGAGGFRTHLVHHWDPQVHSTCPRDVERFLLDSEAGHALMESTTRYHIALAEIARS